MASAMVSSAGVASQYQVLRSAAVEEEAILSMETPYGSIVHVRSVAERAAGPVTITEPSCGHSPHLEVPDETAAAITGFLAGLP